MDRRLLIAIQLITLMKNIHMAGVIYRNIDIDNFCFGPDPERIDANNLHHEK